MYHLIAKIMPASIFQGTCTKVSWLSLPQVEQFAHEVERLKSENDSLRRSGNERTLVTQLQQGLAHREKFEKKITELEEVNKQLHLKCRVSQLLTVCWNMECCVQINVLSGSCACTCSCLLSLLNGARNDLDMFPDSMYHMTSTHMNQYSVLLSGGQLCTHELNMLYAVGVNMILIEI